MSIYDITKEQFLEVYNKHLPNAWTKFSFRYFSTDSEKKDMWLRRVLQGLLFAFFLSGFVGVIFKLSKSFMLCSIIPFLIILVCIAIIMSIGALMNNVRIKKVCKKLNISKMEYTVLTIMYVEE